MKPVFQTRYGKENGNCFQAAVASLFELELKEVPDFCNEHSTATEEWYEAFVEWLRKRGYTARCIFENDLTVGNYKDCYLLVGGKNKEGINHCVIYKNGEVVHNPNKNCSGIKPETIDLIFPLNPKKMMNDVSSTVIALIQKYIGSSLKTVESCIRHYPEAKKYQPLMKTRGELKQILRAVKIKALKGDE